MSSKNAESCLPIMCSNVLKMTGNTLTVLYLFLDVRAFEKWSNRCQLRNFALFKESLKYFALHVIILTFINNSITWAVRLRP